MKKTLLTFLFLWAAVFTGWAEKPGSESGLFGVSRSGADWFFTIHDSLLGRDILASVRFTSTPAGTGSYGGEQVGQQTVYWQLAPDGKLLLRSRLLINAADTIDAINRAVVISNENPVIAAFPVVEKTKRGRRIKVNGFLLEDSPALGASELVKRNMGLQSYQSSLSFVESVKSFPLNTEIRTVKTWSSSSYNTVAGYKTGRVSIGFNISFVLLPEVPMQRRLFDPRVGYFSDQFTYYADHQQRVQAKRFITRWRLEPKDSADAARMARGELVEPRKPIVYYIDPATPKQWRPYLIQGINDWQKAFERAGFKNAIIGREWPENDSTMSMEDARYSVVRYLASPTPNAYGPHIHDPRSGEILESHICWYHNVMTLVHDWYMVQAGTLDEAAQKMKYDTELMGQLIRFVSSHEVGHTLGLRHNFGASSLVPVDSLRSKSWVEANGHTPSIMDYARFNYVAQPEDSISRLGLFPRIGPYDLWAIEWGYRPMPGAYDDDSDHWELERLTQERLKNNPMLWFGDGETNRTNDARCQTEDLGNDAVLAGEYGIRNIKRALPQLEKWTYESNDIYGHNLSTMYDQYFNQFYRYINHVIRNIGAVYYDYRTVDEQAPAYRPATLAHQRRALDFVKRHVITEPTWLIAPSYVSRRLSQKPAGITQRIGVGTVNTLLSAPKLRSLNDEYPVALYLPEVTDLLFASLSGGRAATPYEQALQGQAVKSLISAFTDTGVSPVRSTALDTLQKLQRRLRAATPADKATQAHYASLADLIQRALVVK